MAKAGLQGNCLSDVDLAEVVAEYGVSLALVLGIRRGLHHHESSVVICHYLIRSKVILGRFLLYQSVGVRSVVRGQVSTLVPLSVNAGTLSLSLL